MRGFKAPWAIPFVLWLAACTGGGDGGMGPTSATLWGTQPSVTPGTTTLEVRAQLLRRATVAWAVFAAPQPGITAAEILAEADSASLGSLVAGSRQVGSGAVGDTVTVQLTGLAAGTTAYLYLAAAGTDPDPVATDADRVVPLAADLAPRQPGYLLASATTGGNVGYYAYLPEEHYFKATKRFPLLVFLHGSGEKGNGTTELSKVLVHGPPRLIKNGQDLPFIVISPQLPASLGGWPVGLVDELIARARADYRVDTTRVYVTGLSLGAFGTWAYAVARPQVVAAVVPIAGAGNTGAACQMRTVPVWAFHGDADGTVNVSGSINMINALNACAPPPTVTPKLTIYPGVGHDSWTRTYDGSAGHDVFSWMLTYHR